MSGGRRVEADPVRDETLTLRPAEAAQLLGIGRNAVFDLCRAGVIPHMRLGRRILIPRRLFEEWLERSAQPSAEGAPV